jgi:ABC-type Na+ efflux pump permease subunit
MLRRVLAVSVVVWMGAIRRKEVYVILVLLGALLGAVVSADVFGLGGVVTYVKDVGLLLAWLFGWILAVMTASRELPAEESRGTIFTLVAKPVSRFEIILGKWLGTWAMTTCAVVFFYGFVVAAVAGKGGHFNAGALLQGVLLHALCLAVLAALGILFSTRLGSDAAAALTAVVSAASFLVVPRIPELQAAEAGAGAWRLDLLYHLLPHFEVFDMRLRIVHDFGPVDAGTLFAVLGYGVSLTALLLALAWLAYRTKPFSRGDITS